MDEILAVLVSSHYRKGSLASMDMARFETEHRPRLVRRVVQGFRIQLTLIAFPFKVPNPTKVGDRRLPDLAEVAAIRRLVELNRDVRTVYPPGIEAIIIHDGVYIAKAFGVPVEDARAYMQYFKWLLHITGADGFVRSVDLLELRRPGTLAMSELRVCVRESRAWQRAEEWSRDGEAALGKALGMMNTATVSDHHLYERAWRTAQRYHTLDLILHRFDPRPEVFPDAIHATTRCRPGRLGLWLVERGRGILPWHGVGVLSSATRVKVEWAAETTGPAHIPVHIEGETTPFYYRER